MYIDSDNGLLLVKKLEEIPNVKQVRFVYPLLDNVKELIGEDGLVYSCFIESIDQTNATALGGPVFQTLRVFLSRNTYDNVENHGHIQAMMSERIGEYYRTGVISDTAPRFEYPYSTDADNNQIPYEMTKNNPIR